METTEYNTNGNLRRRTPRQYNAQPASAEGAGMGIMGEFVATVPKEMEKLCLLKPGSPCLDHCESGDQHQRDGVISRSLTFSRFSSRSSSWELRSQNFQTHQNCCAITTLMPRDPHLTAQCGEHGQRSSFSSSTETNEKPVEMTPEIETLERDSLSKL